MEKVKKSANLWNIKKENKIVLEEDVLTIDGKKLRIKICDDIFQLEKIDIDYSWINDINKLIKLKKLTFYKVIQRLFIILENEKNSKKYDDKKITKEKNKMIVEEKDETIVKEKDETIVEEKDETIVEEKDETIVKEKDETIVKEKDETIVEEKDRMIILFNKMREQYDEIIKFEMVDITKWTLYFINEEITMLIELKDFPTKQPIIKIEPKLKFSMNILISNMKMFKGYWKSTITLDYIISKIYSIIKICEKKTDVDPETKTIMKAFDEINRHFVSEYYISIDNDVYSYDPIVEEKTYWKKGTGYGSGSRKNSVDIGTFSNVVSNVDNTIIDNLELIYNEINEKNKTHIKKLIEKSLFIKNYLTESIKDVSLLEINSNKKKYLLLIKLLLFLDMDDLLCCELGKLKNLIEIERKINKSENEIYDFIDSIKTTELIKPIEEKEVKKSYVETMDEYRFQMLNFDYPRYKYKSKTDEGLVNISNVAKEIATFTNVIPIHEDSSIFVIVNEERISEIYFMITGSSKTPYENGCFIFHVKLPTNYPKVPPLVNLENTGGCRFNPNLYSDGKVCLSILGTWSGDKSESWISDKSTLIQVIISIQGLILIEEPYFNEPGYERSIGTADGTKSSLNYNYNIRLYTMQHAIYDLLLDKNNLFYSVIKEHFKLKKNKVIEVCSNWTNESPTNLKNSYNETLKKIIDLLNDL